MQSTPPVLEYSNKRPAIIPVAWQSTVAAFGVVFGTQPFICTCGYLSREALMVTVPTMALAWWGFSRRSSIVGRIFAILVVPLATMAFLKNVLDIGWTGHNPIFR